MEFENRRNNILRLSGIGMLLLGFVLAVCATNGAGEDCFTENLIMTIVTAVSVVVTVLGYFVISVILAAMFTVAYVVYKIYNMMSSGVDFEYASFLWIVIPALCVVGVYLYSKGYSSLALENGILKQQIQEMVMIDRVTGLYNLRSMYMDIQTQISYSERKNTPITLMIIRLRYPAEMRKVLKRDQYEKVVKQLSLLITETVRLEDRVYCVDDMGGFGVILTCDKEGTKLVEKRIREKLEDPKWFSGIAEKRKVRAEIKLGYLQYDNARFKRDANAYKDAVEEEVDYDL